MSAGTVIECGSFARCQPFYDMHTVTHAERSLGDRLALSGPGKIATPGEREARVLARIEQARATMWNLS